MGKNLCIDIGNTKIKSGIFDDDKLVKYIVGLEDLMLEIERDKNLKNCIISSTRKVIPQEILEQKKRFDKFVVLDDKTPLPIEIDYKTPTTLGRDRIATAVAANKLFPNENAIVIDAGTCVTYDFVDKNGVFRGGNISPGIRLRIKAMNEHTGNLPMVEIAINDEPLGKSTIEALQNGAVRGTFLEISSFIQLIIEKYGTSRVIVTGGDAKYFDSYFKNTIFALRNLVLVGLNEILKQL